MLGEGFSLQYSESAGSCGMNSFHEDGLRMDPIKAERLEQRLTASNNNPSLLLLSAQKAQTPPPPPTSSVIEEEETSDQDDVHLTTILAIQT